MMGTYVLKGQELYALALLGRGANTYHEQGVIEAEEDCDECEIDHPGPVSKQDACPA